MEHVFYYDSPIGRLSIAEDGNGITHVQFGECPLAEHEISETGLLREAGRQLRAYFAGESQIFDLPLSMNGTSFQKKVWQALCEIPYGETRTYGELAAAVGNPKAARAVGMANNKNPIAILVPCHRVIGANGRLVGYAGGILRKEKLLRIEGVIL